MDNLPKFVLATIKKYDMLSKGDSLLVAVSGGPDSVSLLHCLVRLKKELDLSLSVFHVNHKLRGKQSDKDEKFVRLLSEKMNLPFIAVSIDTEKYCIDNKLSIEEGARKIRYEKACETANELNANKIATGHTADDAAETFIMRALRGAGLAGLTGIPPVRGNIIRPLIETFRKQILEFCDSNKIDYIIDLSNLDPVFFRNKIRLKVVPKLDEIYPAWKKNMAKTFEILRADFECLSAEADKIFSGITNKRDNYIEIDIEKINKVNVSLRRMIIRKAIEHVAGELKQIEYKHIDFILSKILKSGNFSIDMPGKTIALREYDNLLFKQVEVPLAPVKKQLVIGGATYIPQLNLFFETSIAPFKKLIYDKKVAHLDISKIEGSLYTKTVEEGDRFVPLGMKGTKKIYDYMSDRKIPKRIRERSVVIQDSKKILWLVGHEISELAKIDEQTKSILVIRSKHIEL